MKRKPAPTSYWSISIIILCSLIGCESPTEQPVTEIKFVSANDLLATITERASSASVTDESIDADPRSFRIAVLQKTVNEGLEAFDKLFQSSDVTDEQLSEAHLVKSRLLYLAAKHGGESDQTPLSELAEQLLNERAGTPECESALYYWLRFRYVDQQQPLDETMATVSDFAAMFPNSENTVSLLSAAAVQLGERDHLKEADQLLDLARDADTNATAFLAATNRLKRLKRARQADAANHQSAAMLRQLAMAATGGRTTGYFVMYSQELHRENPKYYRFDYSIRNGIDGVLEYAQSAQSKNWSWKVEASYPDTRTGARDAHNKKALLQRAKPTVLIWNK